MSENLNRPLVTPTLRGVHHLALCTDDMKATIDFYVDVLGHYAGVDRKAPWCAASVTG
jgi:extradiol dioxygenase family protein